MQVNRSKLKASLVLVNLAVLIGAFTFFPRGNRSYTWTNELERIVNGALAGVQWQYVIVICILSALVTSALYLWIDAFCSNHEKPD